MDYKEFAKSKAGRLVKAELGLWAFVPHPLPAAIDYRPDLVELLEHAQAELGALHGMAGQLANPALLVVPYVRREAVLSSRIEGTQSALSDLFLFEAEPQGPPRHVDVREVADYVRAMTEGLRLLHELPLSLRFVRRLHKTLMAGIRGQERTPGEFRRHQNYIGAPGTPIDRATFVPPPVPQMHEALDAWEKSLQVRKGIPVLIQSAMHHYQFEAIHPFPDGNGRVGRLLIPLFLCERGRLTQPLLYLSAFFESYRTEYYERLLAVSRDADWAGWVEFFLRGVASQSRAAVKQATQILHLHQSYHERLQQRRATGPTLASLDRLFENPYVTVKQIGKATGTTVPTAQRIINRLVDAGILQEITGHKWGRVFYAAELLRTLEETPTEHGEAH